MKLSQFALAVGIGAGTIISAAAPSMAAATHNVQNGTTSTNSNDAAMGTPQDPAMASQPMASHKPMKKHHMKKHMMKSM